MAALCKIHLVPFCAAPAKMISTLVLDANAFITGSFAHLASDFVTTAEVLREITDKTAKDALEADLTLKTIKLRQPTSEAVVKVTAFAKATGDLAVLSQVDLRLCALLLTVEVELNGYHHVRPSLGQLSPYEKEREAIRQQRKERRQAKKAERPVPEPAVEAPAAVEAPEEVIDEASTAEDEEDSDGGEWITPDNIASFKKSAPAPVEVPDDAAAPIKAAMLTSDYAMQNVMMQMGLNVIGTNGLKIKEIKTWVLRCHACFK
jgi:RNA-binding protein NOB1